LAWRKWGSFIHYWAGHERVSTQHYYRVSRWKPPSITYSIGNRIITSSKKIGIRLCSADQHLTTIRIHISEIRSVESLIVSSIILLLAGSQLLKAQLSRAQLSRAQLSRAQLLRAQLLRAQLLRAQLDKVHKNRG